MRKGTKSCSVPEERPRSGATWRNWLDGESGDVKTKGALRLADRLFATDYPPHCPDGF